MRGIRYALPVASAQVKSCVLLAGLFAEGETAVVEPKPTRYHTERMLSAMGAAVSVSGLTVTLRSGADALRAGEWMVPGDFSSAAYWLAAGACGEESEVTVAGVGLNGRRTALLKVLERMGAEIEVKASACGKAEWEPRGDVLVRGGALRGTEVAGEEIPNLIDELPLVAALGALAEGETVIRDAAELRVKESDRIATMAEGLRRLGVAVNERPDGMTVRGPSRVRGNVAVESRGDHRVAMALSVLALFAGGPVEVRGTACVRTSYPGFLHDLERLRDAG